jgi:hypothetical protein
VPGRDTGMVALGYGKFVRARDIVALVRIEDDTRGDGRRTYVHVDGLSAPIVASRSERAILSDMERVPNVASGARAREGIDDAPGAAVPRGEGGGRRWRPLGGRRTPGDAHAEGRRDTGRR